MPTLSYHPPHKMEHQHPWDRHWKTEQQPAENVNKERPFYKKIRKLVNREKPSVLSKKGDEFVCFTA